MFVRHSSGGNVTSQTVLQSPLSSCLLGPNILLSFVLQLPQYTDGKFFEYNTTCFGRTRVYLSGGGRAGGTNVMPFICIISLM